MPNVVHFEICVDDMERATRFYSRVFGWKIEKIDDGSEYRLIYTSEEDEEAITGGLTMRFDDWDSTVNTIDVASVDAFARKVADAGGKVVAPKSSVPGVGYVQYCQDAEGNSFAIMEYDDSAP